MGRKLYQITGGDIRIIGQSFRDPGWLLFLCRGADLGQNFSKLTDKGHFNGRTKTDENSLFSDSFGHFRTVSDFSSLRA